MTLTIDIDDAIAQEILDGFSAATGWNSDSKVSQNDWVCGRVVLWIKEVAKEGMSKIERASSDQAIDASPVTATISAITPPSPPVIIPPA